VTDDKDVTAHGRQMTAAIAAYVDRAAPLMGRRLFESLCGHEAIIDFRVARLKINLSRSLKNTVITTFGKDYGTANTELITHDPGRAGRQSHTWVRTDDDWRSVAAHVSWFTPPPA
jgi:hypothetical protein